MESQIVFLNLIVRELGKSMPAYNIESFNRRFRNECLFQAMVQQLGLSHTNHRSMEAGLAWIDSHQNGPTGKDVELKTTNDLDPEDAAALVNELLKTMINVLTKCAGSTISSGLR